MQSDYENSMYMFLSIDFYLVQPLIIPFRVPVLLLFLFLPHGLMYL